MGWTLLIDNTLIGRYLVGHYWYPHRAYNGNTRSTAHSSQHWTVAILLIYNWKIANQTLTKWLPCWKLGQSNYLLNSFTDPLFFFLIAKEQSWSCLLLEIIPNESAVMVCKMPNMVLWCKQQTNMLEKLWWDYQAKLNNVTIV